MLACAACGFAWNSAFDESRNLYDPAYDNDQMQSEQFRSHAAAMMQRILDGLPHEQTIRLVEVGCGQGGFLQRLARVAEGRFASLTGFDPAWRGKADGGLEGVQIHGRYFGPGAVGLIGGQVEAVVTRHTIEHVPDPLQFLRTIGSCMSSAPEARLFVETPDVEWILRNFQLQDLFYEHCSLFSPRSIEFALTAAGFEPIRIERVFGDQYLWAEARPSREASFSANSASVSARDSFQREITHFSSRRGAIIATWRETINERSKAEDVWLWGASSKGVTFALLVDPDASTLKGAVDINQNKAGKFMPITGLPIVAPHSLPDGATVIVMNPNYQREIERSVSDMGKSAQFVTLGEF
jgi:SAM-dependent methyltransferase